MNLELCCQCHAPTGRAGRHDDSLYAGDYGPYCEDCWGDVPDMLAEQLATQQARINALTAEIEEQARLLGASGSREAELLARVEALEKEQSAWRKFTDEANRTLEAADKKIATLQARIEALEAERRWMPFEKPEQLPQTMWAPNYSDPILVAILSGKTRFVRDDRYDFVQDRWDSGCVGVTHWMPLPEPPEAEK